MASKPPLELAVEITAADGSQYRWGSGAKTPGDVPQGLSFRTRRGDGFADGNITLSRRIDQDYVDLSLLDSVVISGAEGSIAYEGRVSGLPRSLSQAHSVTVQTAGWMAHTRDRKMSEIYVDRDLSRWDGMSMGRRLIWLTGGAYAPTDPNGVSPDRTDGAPALVQETTGPWGAAAQPLVEGWYDAGSGNAIGSIYYAWQKTSTVNPANTNWSWVVQTATDDKATAFDTTANLRAAGPSTGTLVATSNNKRFGLVQFSYAATDPTGTAGVIYGLYWTSLAVYGNHGLIAQGAAPGGIYASDAIKHLIGKYCPLLNTSGVQSTTYPIPHLAFRDRVDPYDALLEINKYHLWQLGVYENRTLCYGPVDMSDYDWEVRLSDPGVSVDLQGDSSDDLANGIVVTYTDVAKGTTAVITPLDNTALADTSPDNPVNAHGLTRWIEITLSTPSTAEAAVQIGRTALAEYNQAKAPGTITVQGHIRDRQGHYQPAWRCRAGDRVAITDHPNDRPRLVAETSYEHDSKTIQIATDQTFKRLDAVIDRIAGAVSAAGLG